MKDPTTLLLLAAIVLVTPAVLVGIFGIRRVAFGMMIAAAFTISMNNLRPTAFMTVSDVALFGALPLAIRQRPGHLLNTKALVGAASLIVLGGLIGTFFTLNSTESMAGVARFATASVLIGLLFTRWQPGGRELRALSWAVVLGTSLNSLIGILYIRTYYGRAQGLSFQSNHLGIACLLAAGVALTLAVTSRNPQRWAAILSGVILSAGVVYSGSRAALVGLGFLGIAALIVSRDRRLLRLAFVALIGIGLAFQSGLIKLPEENAISRLVNPEVRSVSVADRERDVLREQSLQRAEEHPLTGTGFEDALQAHSLYIQTWASAGVVGLLGLAWLALIGVRILMWSYGRHRFVAAMAVTFVAFMVCAIESNNMWDRFIWFHLVLVTAAADHAMTVEALDAEEVAEESETATSRRLGFSRRRTRPYRDLGRAY